MDKRIFLMLILSVILIIALLSIAYYKTELGNKNNLLLRVEADRSCDLQKNACSLKIPDGGVVTLSMEPRPIPLVQELNIKVQTLSINAEKIAIKFNGTDMNMGPNNVTLMAQENGIFTGTGMLPVCIRNSMEWQAEVYVQTEDGIIIAPFIFETRKKY